MAESQCRPSLGPIACPRCRRAAEPTTHWTATWYCRACDGLWRVSSSGTAYAVAALPHGVVALVPHADRRRVLLIRSAKRGGIELPAGTVEPGESRLDALTRELREETSMVATAAQLVTTKVNTTGRVVDVYTVAATGIPSPGDDALEAFWGDPRLLLGGSHPEDHETTQRVLVAARTS